MKKKLNSFFKDKINEDNTSNKIFLNRLHSNHKPQSY